MGLEKKAEEASNASKGQDRGESIHVNYLEGLKRMRAGKRDEKGVSNLPISEGKPVWESETARMWI